MDKKLARAFGLNKRNQLSVEQRAIYDAVILSKAIQLVSGCKHIATYVSYKSEVDTCKLIKYCFENNIEVSVPVMTDNTLVFSRIESFDELKKNSVGILEPEVLKKVSLSDIDIMFVPLSSYDKNNQRTGYGRGYYDSILRSVRLKVGLAYPEQKVDEISSDSWDIPLDFVLSVE